MNIIVEIGTPEEQALIKKELSLVVEHVCNSLDPPLPVLEVIVPRDFDATVNRVGRRTSFKSDRTYGIVAGKIIRGDNGAIIVFSPALYDNLGNVEIRVFLQLHEVCHIYNSRRFQQLSSTSKIPLHYFSNLYIMYDEYSADRMALNYVDYLFPEKPDSFQTHIRYGMEDFRRLLVDDFASYHVVKTEIQSFRQHGDVMQFLRGIDEIFDATAKAIAHGYAYIDHFPQFQNQALHPGASKFYNDRAQRLVEFMRAKYDEDSVDLLDGIPLMEGFMRNFGVRFEVLPSGEVYCHVLDI
jgi:hypothetical protein